jgi:hypothetical protein
MLIYFVLVPSYFFLKGMIVLITHTIKDISLDQGPCVAQLVEHINVVIRFNKKPL